ncbi:MAG: phosphorylase family protein [Halothiobacillus sp.]
MDKRLNRFGLPIIYTGVGKINATLQLTEALTKADQPYSTVINLGSAGSHRFAAGTVICATHFFERDMDATALGFALGQTPFETEIHLRNGMTIPGLQQATCYTGDSFVTERHATLSLDVIDMEAYALAKTCLHKNTEFVALKFITDGADGQAADNWTEAVTLAALHLELALETTLHHLRSL